MPKKFKRMQRSNPPQNSGQLDILSVQHSDILAVISGYLSDINLLNLSQVSRRYASLLQKRTIWQPRFYQHFETNLPFGDNAKVIYFSLLKEECQAMNAFVALRLTWQTFKSSKPYKECNEMRKLLEFPSFKNNARCTSLLDGPQLLDEQYTRARNILEYIYHFPPASLNQAAISTRLALYNQMLYADLHGESAVFFIERFTELFPNADCTVLKDQKKYAACFVEMLLCIVSGGCFELMKLLIHKHPDLPNIRFDGYDNLTWLHCAIRNHHYPMALYLIDKGSNVNLCQDSSGTFCPSPLYIAVSNLLEEVKENINYEIRAKSTIKFINNLIQAGADPKLTCRPNDAYRTPQQLVEGMITKGPKFAREYLKQCYAIFTSNEYQPDKQRSCSSHCVLQ
jgi:hypothetical protein